MRRFALIAATIIGVVCLSSCEWEPIYLWYPKDNSKITMNITCPSLGLENTTFCNTERDWPEITTKRLLFLDDTSFCFLFSKDFISTDSKYNALLKINLNNELPSFELGHKYNINDPDDTGYNRDYISLFINSTLDIKESLDGYIVFTSCELIDRKYCISGNFEFIFEDAIISNGTFTDLKCSRF